MIPLGLIHYIRRLKVESNIYSSFFSCESRILSIRFIEELGDIGEWGPSLLVISEVI